MNGCVMEEESVYHSYGLSVSGTVGALSFTEEYKKTELSLSGFYNYQSGVKGNPSIKQEVCQHKAGTVGKIWLFPA